MPWDELNFTVQVSNDTPHYTVIIRRDEHDLSARCTCENGDLGALCKHRLSILSGQTKWVISNNIAGVKTVRSWVVSTDVGQAIIKLVRSQKRLQDAHEELERVAQLLCTTESEVEAAAVEVNVSRGELVQAINH